MKKSILAMVLCFVFLFTSVSFVFATSPVEMNVKQASETYNEQTGGAETIISPSSQNPKIGMTKGDYVVFSADISEAGDYSLFFYAGTKTSDTKIKVSYKTANSEYVEALTGDVGVNGSTISVAASSFGVITLPSGSVSIKFESLSGNCNFSRFVLERATAFEITSITANKEETAISENAVVPRSTSTLAVNFSGSIDKTSVTEDTVKLKKGEDEVKINLTPSVSKIDIVIPETLLFDTEYTLIIDGVLNAAKVSEISDYAVTFKTSTDAQDSGSAEIKDDSTEIAVRNIYISGKLVDSNGVGVKGRNVSVYYTPAGSAELSEPVETLVTEEEGAFNFSYILPKNSKGGDYVFRVKGEYAESKTYTFNYDENAAQAALTQKFNVTQRNSSLCKPENDAIIKPDSENPYISFNWGVGNYDYQTFDVNIAEAGYYAISMIANCGNGNKVRLSYALGASTDFDSNIVTEITTTTTNGVFAPIPMALIELPEGLVKIRFTMTYADISFSGFEIKYLSKLSAKSVSANDVVINDGDTVKRGTDVFSVEFSEAVDANLADAVISLKDENGKQINVKAEADQKTVKVNLLESLDYGKKYKLSVAGVKDSFGAYTADDFEINVVTSDKDTDSGSAEIVDASAVCNYVDISVMAKMISSSQNPISGRYFEIYLKNPDGVVSKEPVIKGITGENGAISGNIRMSLSDKLGIYTFIIKGDYITTPKEIEVDYNAKAFGVEKLTVNKDNTEVENGTVVKRSTSLFTVEFTGKVDVDTVTKENVVLLKGSKVVPVTITSDSLKAQISPVNTLDYESEYTLCIDGIKDEPGIYKITNYSISFKTSDKAGDNTVETISELSASVAGRAVSVKGMVTDENGVGLAGREVLLFFTPQGGAETENAVSEAFTKEGGAFTVNYSLPEGSEEGEYGFKVTSEYGAVETCSVTYDKEAAIEALTQEINVRDHNEALSVPQSEQIFGSENSSYISFNGFAKDIQVFDIVIPEEGNYALNLLAGTGAGATMNVYYTLDGSDEEVLIKELSTVTTGGVTAFGSQPIGFAHLPAGNVRIKFAMTNSDIHFRGFEIKYLNKIDVNKVAADGTEFTDGETIKRGTDAIEIIFTENVNINMEGADISIKDEQGEKIEFIKEASAKTITLKLSQSFDYEKTYTLSVSGVADMYDAYKISKYEMSFKTSDKASDKGSAQIAEISGNADYQGLTVTAKMLSSKGIAMSGRNFCVYVENPEGVKSETPVYSGTSGVDGKIEYKHIMTQNDMGGKYTFTIDGDYVAAPQKVELIYISKDIEESISNQIKNATSAQDIENLLKENEVVLDIDLDSDLDGVSDVAKVFEHIKGEDAENLSEIKKLYRGAIALEKINQAIIPARIDAVLSDEQACSDLGLDKELMDLIIDTDDEPYRTNFISDVLALDIIENIDDVKDALEDVVNKNLAHCLGKTALTSAAENTSASKGEGAAVALATTTAVNDAEKIIFKIEADSELLEKASAKAKAGTCKAWVKDDVLIVEIVPDKTAKDIKDFGTAYLSTEVSEGEYDVKISAEVYYKVKCETEQGDIMVSVVGEMTEKTVKATITQKSSSSSSTQRPSSTSPGSSRPSGGGGGSSSVTPPTASPTETPTEKPIEKFEFVDLGEASWAKESIEKLLEKGIISESDDKKFNPNVNVKREEFIKMIVMATGILDNEAKCDFKDVNENNWYYPFVASAYQKGITKGRDDNNFGAGDYITREDMATLICRAFEGIKAIEDSELFADDESISAYAKEAVYTLKALNVINGMGDNLYVPKGIVTRAQAAKVIAGLLK